MVTKYGTEIVLKPASKGQLTCGTLVQFEAGTL